MINSNFFRTLTQDEQKFQFKTAAFIAESQQVLNPGRPSWAIIPKSDRQSGYRKTIVYLNSRLKRFVRSRVEDHSAAEDIIQQAILKALEAEGRFIWKQEQDFTMSVWVWLKAIAVNEIRMAHRVNRFRRHKELRANMRTVSPHDAVEAGIDIENSLSGLNSKMQSAMMLRAEGYTAKEICAKLRITRFAYYKVLSKYLEFFAE